MHRYIATRPLGLARLALLFASDEYHSSSWQFHIDNNLRTCDFSAATAYNNKIASCIRGRQWYYVRLQHPADNFEPLLIAFSAALRRSSVTGTTEEMIPASICSTCHTVPSTFFRLTAYSSSVLPCPVESAFSIKYVFFPSTHPRTMLRVADVVFPRMMIQVPPVKLWNEILVVLLYMVRFETRKKTAKRQ